MSFYNDIPSRHNVVSSFTTNNPKYDFWAFAKGYHLAAKTLADRLLKENGFPDYDGYPIVFLYRHAFELRLKDIIYWSTKLASFRSLPAIDNKLYITHNLSELSQAATNLLLKVSPKSLLLKAPPSESDILRLTDKMRKVAREYDEIDSTSFSYRYPIDREGNPSTKHHQVVSILSISQNMEELLDNLEEISYGLQGEVDGIMSALDNF